MKTSTINYGQLLADVMTKKGFGKAEFLSYNISKAFMNHEAVSFDEETMLKLEAKGHKHLLPFLLRNASIGGVSLYPWFKQALEDNTLVDWTLSICNDVLGLDAEEEDVKRHCTIYITILEKSKNL